MTDSITPARVRFAPSPTGYLHIGGARTALFNWLFARHTGGKFLLRIEDTDLERSTLESVQQILDSLHWLGLHADEPVEYQTQRAELHRQYVQRLIETGAAYHDFCTKDRLEQLREQAKAEGRPFAYRRSLVPPHEMERYRAAGEPGVIRLIAPEEGSTGFDDLVYGRIDVPNSNIGDFVIARADGSPLYNFTNAIDDIDMRITHVCRGEDHVSNTSRQVLVYQALGVTPPLFAHLPLILGTDKKRLSKRHGATSVMQFRDDGILPQALINFVALLGWAPEGEAEFEEVMTIDQLISKFTLDKVNRSSAVFDYEKLHWMDGVYIRQMPKEQLYAAVVPQLDAHYGAAGGPEEHATRGGWLRGIIDLQIERSRTLNDFAKNLDYFFAAPADYEEKAVKKFLATAEQLQQVRETITEMQNAWPATAGVSREELSTALDTHLRQWSETKGLKFGNVVPPIRLALTGRTASPPLFDVIYYLGKDEVLRRMRNMLDTITPPVS
ncbi:MAG: glutamate--tRNA ligase [Candidatus Sumerlaeaceae bacterium]